MLYSQRLKNLQDLLKSHECDAFIIDNPLNLFYLTGFELSTGKAIVHQQGAELFVDNRYYEMCQKNSPFPVFLSEQHPLKERLSLNEFHFIKTLGFDSESTSYQQFLDLDKLVHLIPQYSKGRRKITLVPLPNLIKTIRTIKDEKEIQLLKEAAILGSKGFDYVCTLLKEGITECEVALELEIFWKRHGGKKLAFDSIIAFGENSSMPHYRAGEKKLEKNQSVLIDIGVNYKHYHSDMTRVVFFGLPPEAISVIYPIVQLAQKKALEVCRPGILIAELDQTARNFIESQGYGENFTHSLGHGVGLEIHELPILKDITPYNEVRLQPGMVITIEPGIYLPGVGGVRIEDTILITQDGYENLTNRSTNPMSLKI